MRNGKLLMEYLDECAENLRLMQSNDIAELEELGRRYEEDRTGQLEQALLADGWTFDELNDAYRRRLNVQK